MKNITRIAIVAVFLSLVTATPASAGLMDWLNGSNEESTLTSASQYIASAWQNDKSQTDSSPIATIQGNTVMATKSPATKAFASKIASRKYTVSVSAYSSTPDQTDDSPFITAKGTYVRDGIVATNFLPFGTAIKIPEIYGNKIFVVEDRMNKRYQTNVDVWMTSREAALKFGRRTLTIEVLAL